MKYTTLIAAGLAAGVSADDWSSWTSSKPVTASSTVTCPKKVTQTITTTADCAEVTSEIYQTTITVKAPETETVTVYADGKTIGDIWEQWTYTPAPKESTKLPHGCVPKVVTSTATEYKKKVGSTVTITKSTLFVGAGDHASTTVTVTASGSAVAESWSAGDYGAPAATTGGSGSWSAGDYGAPAATTGSGSWSAGNDGDSNGWNNVEGPEFTTAPEGWRIPISDKIVAATWLPTGPAITNTKSYSAPAYTQKPDGSYGAGSGWEGVPVGPGSGKNSTYPGGKNSTAPSWNVTAGSPGSNVTKPILPLADGTCNSAEDRSVWCDGRTSATDTYLNYYTGHTCSLDLTLSRAQLDLDGGLKDVIAFNGQVPGPLLECNWGDIIEVTVTNAVSDNGTSVHWHGFRQVGTNNMDGVPGITECPLAPGESKTYTFHASSYGTTWYHSHWVSQYGDGAYGPIIIHGPATANYDFDMGTVLIQDGFNDTAAQQNYEIAHFGPKSNANYLLNGHNTKYDLSSGQHTLWSVEAGKKYLFRLVNTAAQNAYSVSLDDHTMTVIAADFVPIVPYQTQWVNLGIGQRHDVVIEMNQKVDSYFLRAVTQLLCPGSNDNTGLGNANGIVAYQGVDATPYQLPTSSATKTLADFNTCKDEPLASLVPFVPMTAGTSSAFEASASTIPATTPQGLQTSDNGVVFQWFLNNGAINVNFTQPSLLSLAQGQGLNTTLVSNPIVLEQNNEWVYFVIQNFFFAAHPIHLHGHDFSLLGQGEGLFDVSTMTSTLNFVNPMRRDTAMLQGATPEKPGTPAGYTVIGFQTDNPGTWLMHCHIIWHVDGGLAVQWVERPKDIPYADWVNPEFKEECKAYVNYESTTPGAAKLDGESGLRKRASPFFDEQVSKIMGNQFDDVVRRSDNGAKHYLDTHIKRRFGDGSQHRV